jgi:hypothetical protein
VDRQKALAAADGIREKMKAEAEGLTDKAAGMAAMDDATRAHEEYRLRLEAEKEIRLAGLEVQREVAEAQATVLATGLEKADIDIVGGDTMFFDKVVGAISVGKGVDGFVEHSDVAQSLAKPWLNGSRSFPDDLTRLLGSVNTDDVKNLTLSALLMQRIRGGGADGAKAKELLDHAERLGVADAAVSSVAVIDQ